MRIALPDAQMPSNGNFMISMSPNPHGEVLNTFPWIAEVRLVQHANPEKRAFFEEREADEEQKSEFDTQPLKVRKPVNRPTPAETLVPRHLPANQRIRSSISARHPPKSGLEWNRLHAPIMVAIFLLLFAMSYFNLLHYRNQNHRRSQTHDSAILP